MLQEISLFQGHLIGLFILVAIVALFILFFNLARWTEKKEEKKELKGKLVDACLGAYDGKEGFYCTFSPDRNDSICFKGILCIEDDKTFNPGDRVRAEVIDCGGKKIYLKPLAWPKEPSHDYLRITFCDEDSNWHCVYESNGFQKVGVIRPEKFHFKVRSGDAVPLGCFMGTPLEDILE